MAAGELRIRDLPIHYGYSIASPDMLLTEVAMHFRHAPDDALLIHDREGDEFLGVVYLVDFHRAYGIDGLKSPQNKTITEIMNSDLAWLDWNSNVTQAIAKARLQTPHGILVRDERGRFAGFLSTTDLNVERERMDRLAAQHRRA